MPKLVETTYEVKGIQSMEAIMQQVLREDHRGLILILRQEPNGVLKATGAMPVPREPNLVLLCHPRQHSLVNTHHSHLPIPREDFLIAGAPHLPLKTSDSLLLLQQSPHHLLLHQVQ